MIKLRGFGGGTEFWDHNLESFTLMAGLALAAAIPSATVEFLPTGGQACNITEQSAFDRILRAFLRRH